MLLVWGMWGIRGSWFPFMSVIFPEVSLEVVEGPGYFTVLLPAELTEFMLEVTVYNNLNGP